MAAVRSQGGRNTVSEKTIREVQELFKGRFPQDVIQRLFDHFDGDKKAVVDYLLKGRQSLELEQDTELKEINTLLDSLTLSDESVSVLQGKIETTVRQFACVTCDKDWWQRVPVRKEVSTCKECKKKYDPIDRDDEFGWAIYNCQCGHKFNGYGQKNKTTSPCYKCDESVMTHQIKPKGRRRRKSNNAHKCDGKDCAFKDAHDTAPSGGRKNRQGNSSECVHPRSRAEKGKRSIVVASNPHVSTGSTVDTFLPQDLDAPFGDDDRGFLSSDDESRLRAIAE